MTECIKHILRHPNMRDIKHGREARMEGVLFPDRVCHTIKGLTNASILSIEIIQEPITSLTTDTVVAREEYRT